jgi:FtsZ-interacting cell division protein YlmF
MQKNREKKRKGKKGKLVSSERNENNARHRDIMVIKPKSYADPPTRYRTHKIASLLNIHARENRKGDTARIIP